MATSADQTFIMDAIKVAVRLKIENAIEEETQAMQRRVATRVAAAADEIALSIMRHYRAYIDRDEIHIVVTKELNKP